MRYLQVEKLECNDDCTSHICTHRSNDEMEKEVETENRTEEEVREKSLKAARYLSAINDRFACKVATLITVLLYDCTPHTVRSQSVRNMII